jgi:hypothetical protein
MYDAPLCLITFYYKCIPENKFSTLYLSTLHLLTST